MALVPFAPVLWILIPWITAAALRRNFKLGILLIPYGLVAGFSLNVWLLPEAAGIGVSQLPAIDLLALVFLYAGGVFCHLARQWGRDKLISGVFIFVIFSFLSVVGMAALQGGIGPGLSDWMDTQASSRLIPVYRSVPETLSGAEAWEYEGLYKPLLYYGFFALFGISTGLLIFINYLLMSIFPNARSNRSRQLVRAWMNWRAAPWAPLVIVAGLLPLVFSSNPLELVHFQWFNWLGWNVLFLGLFPIFLGGLSFLSFLLPRVPFILTLAVLVIAFILPLTLPALLGFLDVVLNLRHRWKKWEQRSQESDS